MASENSEEQVVESTQITKGKLVMNYKLPTPKWATWVFRTEFILNKAAIGWMLSADIIPSNRLKVVVATMNAVDFVFWGFGRLLGIKPPDISETKL